MFRSIKYTLFVTLVITSLFITACGAGNAAEATQALSSIQTAVAETVAAQNAAEAANTPTSAAPVVTQTPLVFSPTLTPLVPTQTSNPVASGCGQASLISETIPDGTIYAPGLQFTKTWVIKNTSNCSWNTSYKIIFWDGDVLGGAYVYNLPQAVDAGQTVPISLLLTAPTATATYTSKWMLQTPDGVNFGVGQYNAPFYAEIVVSSNSKPNYAITSVEYSVVRTPATGCPANVSYVVYATLTSNGPIQIQYQWQLGKGREISLENPKTLKFTEAGSQTISNETVLHLGNTPGDQRWKAVIIVDPYRQEFPRINFNYDCGS
jgi:hypothetical protein